MAQKKEVNMLSGSIVRTLLKISFPVMFMNVFQSMFNIIDMTILKAYDTDGLAVGAVGVSGTLISLITGLVIGVSTGANVIIARNIGRKNQQSVDRAIASSMAFALAAGLALAVIGIGGARLFLGWMNCPDKLLSQATLYFQLYFAGVPILMVYNFCASILRASGDSMRPMIYMTIAGVIKIIVSYLLIAVFHMGVMGVAFATILSWTVAAALCFAVLLRSNGTVKICINRIRFHRMESRQILHIGIPAGMQQALYSIANVMITATVNSFGPEATTGVSIANNFDTVQYQISVATSLAVMPFVSQNIGSGNVKRAMQAVWKGILITVCLGATFGGLSALFSTQLSSIMSSDPVVIAYSKQKMIIISSTYFISGINEIFGAALRGMGKPFPATIATLVYMCLFRFVWVYFIFPLMPSNLTFLYLVWPVGWCLSIITLLFVFFPTVKKLSRTAATIANA